jgi:hypothetical protein
VASVLCYVIRNVRIIPGRFLPICVPVARVHPHQIAVERGVDIKISDQLSAISGQPFIV